MFSLTTPPEQNFLIRLLVGELRQGALEGVMIDAIAAAAPLPVAEVRRAAMYSSLSATRRCRIAGRVGWAAALSAPDALAAHPDAAAQTAADPGEALDQLRGDVAFEWKLDGARASRHTRRATTYAFSPAA